MKIKSKHNGSALVEYVLVFILVGLIFGYSLHKIQKNKSLSRDFMKNTFGNQSNIQNGQLNIKISDTVNTGISAPIAGKNIGTGIPKEIQPPIDPGT